VQSKLLGNLVADTKEYTFVDIFTFIDSGVAWDHSLDTSKYDKHCLSIKVYCSLYNNFKWLDVKIKFSHLEQLKFIKPISQRFSFDF
jgi:hypothetical protein